MAKELRPVLRRRTDLVPQPTARPTSLSLFGRVRSAVLVVLDVADIIADTITAEWKRYKEPERFRPDEDR